MIPEESDAISPAPQHDIYSIEDLRLLIYAIKESSGYKPVCVKIAAVHNAPAIASGIVRAGADMVYIDGYRGGSGATPSIVRDNVGIPAELALAAVDQRLREEGIRNLASLIIAGGFRSSADIMKAIALGAGLDRTGLTIDIEGIAGEDLAFCLGGPTIIARGHGQNAVANTMDSGTVIIHGLAGDAAGLGLVAESIRKGKECAERIDAELQGKKYTSREKEQINIFDLKLNAVSKCSSQELLPVKDEYRRCLHCGICVRCDACVEACPRKARVRDEAGFTVDLEKCGDCGSCAATCLGGVIRMMPRDQF